MIYKKNMKIYLFTSFATMCLGVFLLIPFLNNHILNAVIREETGIYTRYYYRPMSYSVARDSKQGGKEE